MLIDAILDFAWRRFDRCSAIFDLSSGAARSARVLIRSIVIVSMLILAPEGAAATDAIYAITPNGDMLFYRYTGMADGSNTWAVEQKKIGFGWNFKQVIAGNDGAIYAITPNGDMLFYRYTGMADGSNTWAVEQKKIGFGWNFKQVTGSDVLLNDPGPAQRSCSEVMCPNGSQSTGNFPDCFCGSDPDPSPTPTEPTCERDVQCIDPSQIAVGTWPACGCRSRDEPDRPPEGGSDEGSSGFHPGLGGVTACNDLFTCPPFFVMDVQDDTCICKLP